MESERDHLAKVFGKIQDKVNESQMPEMDDVKELVRLSRLLQHNAEEDWVAEAEDFMLLAQKLFHAVKRNDLEDSVIVVDQLEELFRLLPEE
jgi:XXXCH domain-containing protein